MEILKYYILLVFFAVQLDSQVIVVKDRTTNEPIETAKITNIQNGKKLFTNAEGKADISEFKGVDSIMVNQFGYERLILKYSEIIENKNTVLLKGTGITFDELVVSASKWKQDKREIPIRVSTVNKEDVTFQNPQTAADLLTVSGEVYVQKSQLGGGSPMIRGFSTNRVLLSVDGVRMNNALFRSGNLQNVIALDPFTIDNTEVIFGPGSTIYGSDAIGGVMSFYTKKAKLSSDDDVLFKGNATLRTASANFEKTGHIDLNLGFQKWAFLTSYTYTDFNDLRMGSNGPDDYLRTEYQTRIGQVDTVLQNSDSQIQKRTGYNQFNVMQRAKFQPNKKWDFDYGFHYSETSDYPRYDRLVRYSGDKLRSAEWYYGPQIWMMNNINIDHDEEMTLYSSLGISLAHQYFKESRHDRDFGDIMLTNRTEKVQAYSINVDFKKDFSENQKLFYGLETVLNLVSSNGTSENTTTGTTIADLSRYPDGSDWSSYSAYLSYMYKFNKKLNLQLGTRYNYYSINAEFDDRFYDFPFDKAENNGGALTGSAGLVYNPDRTWQLIANVSTGFRAPNIDDIGKVFDSEPGAVVVPNPDLSSEYAYNFELGAAKIINESVKIDISAYYTLLEDALIRRNYSLNGKDSIIYDGELSQVQAIQNASQANVWGLQTGLEVKLPLDLTLLSRFNYQKGEEELDNGTTAPLRHAAPWFGRTHLIYSINKLRADLYFEYNGELSNEELAPSEQGKDFIYALDSDGNPYSPSWFTINLKAEYRINDRLKINAGVENILDKRYRPYSSGISAPGINFIGAVRVNI